MTAAILIAVIILIWFFAAFDRYTRRIAKKNETGKR